VITNENSNIGPASDGITVHRIAPPTTQKTRLYELHDQDFLTGSWLHEEMKKVGEDRSPRSLINDWNCWNMTVETFLHECSYSTQFRAAKAGRMERRIKDRV
jgi:hypothetical protein